MHAIDREQRNVKVLDNPVPEPIRFPVGHLPQGFRLCWVCDGAGYAIDQFDAEQECANCHGEGYIPNAPIDDQG